MLLKTSFIVTILFCCTTSVFAQHQSKDTIDNNTIDTLQIRSSINFIYPDEARLNGIQGKVIIRIYLNEKCEIIKHEFIKKLGYGCDEAAEKELHWIEEQIKQNKKGSCPIDSLLIPFNFVM